MKQSEKRIPEELENDAIVEAVLEIRFDMETVPEVFFGRLADFSPWKGFRQRRLPAYEIPPPVRQADANLRYQPVFELVSEAERRSLRVGAHVVSYHKREPYGGWRGFKSQLIEVIDALFLRSEKLVIRRLGLRYINAINSELHKLPSVADLDIVIRIEGQDVNSDVNLNFSQQLSPQVNSTVRIATPEFVQGALPDNTSMIIDVDIYTSEDFRTRDKQQVIDWVGAAHDAEKAQFFRLLKSETIEALRKKEDVLPNR